MAPTFILSKGPPLGLFTWNEAVIQIIAQSFWNCDLRAISCLAKVSEHLVHPFSACPSHSAYLWYQRSRSETERLRNSPKSSWCDQYLKKNLGICINISWFLEKITNWVTLLPTFEVGCFQWYVTPLLSIGGRNVFLSGMHVWS